jgi:hypothetical protein
LEAVVTLTFGVYHLRTASNGSRLLATSNCLSLMAPLVFPPGIVKPPGLGAKEKLANW